MKLGNTFSPEPTYGKTLPNKPVSQPEYTNGVALEKVNVRPNIHNLDAMLNDMNVPEKKVIETIKAMSPEERMELENDKDRCKRIKDSLDSEELKQIGF